jgi:glycosyltransferase involved in cell wall biosynthesis
MKVVIPVGSLETGGGCKILVDIANALVDKGHDTEIVIPQGAPIVYSVRCKITRVPSLSKEYIPQGDIVLPNFYTTFRAAYDAWPEQCVRLCQGFEPYWVKDVEYAKWTYTRNVPVISVSKWLDEQIYKLTGRRGKVVSLGVNPAVFYPGKPRKGLRMDKRKIILYIARDPKLGYQLKGFRDFYRSMKLINEKYKGKFIVYLICPERKLPFKGIAHKIFVPKTAKEVADLYRVADLFVSTSWVEGFGLPPLEAMACGTPVVTTNSGGVMDYCLHLENAYVTVPKKTRSIASSIIKVLFNRKLASRLAQNGLRTASLMTEESFKRKFVQTLEEIHRNRKK